jgi:carbamoyltransferase
VRRKHDGSPFLGRNYSDAEIEHALAQGPAMRVERPPDIAEAIADRLAAGRTVAWFRGGSEFGPRALGHRSILADPRAASMRDYINTWVKFREDFRPFAPAVLAEDATEYFELSCESPYMLFVVPVRAAWRKRLGAVTHVDGTARVQTVSRESDADFHRLLSVFKDRTGIGVLLNTSLNRRGEPMVETPGEALALLRETALDDLAIGPWLVSRTSGGLPA